ncbi:MAG: HDIG domain-containing protein [Armatimonadetes bacterium]|nr:HDIG domain-containing protein [Armatimonadota bacterium]
MRIPRPAFPPRLGPEGEGRARKAVIALTVVVALALAASVEYFPERLSLQEGQVSPRDLEALRTVDFIDWDRTIERRQQAAAAIQPVYRLSPAALEEARGAAVRAFDAVIAARQAAGVSPDERLAQAKRELRMALPDDVVAAALQAEAVRLEEARTAALRAVGQVMSEGVRREDLDRARMRVQSLIRGQPLNPEAARFAEAAATQAVRPTLLVEEAETARLRRRAMDTLEPVQVRVLRGEIVVRRGEVVTKTHLLKLQALGLTNTPLALDRLAGMLLLSAMLVAVTAVYLRQYHPDIWQQDRTLILLGALGLVFVVVGRVVVTRVNPYLMPMAAAPMLMAILLRARLALFVASVLAFFAGAAAGNDFHLGIVTLVGSLAGIFAVRRVQHRIDLAYAGLKVGIANAGVIIALRLVDQFPLYPDMLFDTFSGMANGFLAGLVALGTLPILENLFGLVTPIKLLELADPSHPLLRRLQLEAPGTYHHSIMVGNLAEAAAEVIGGHSLLVRVGTYYHDVGKLRRPVFFAENQIGVENPHDKMSPSLSALTVVAHVRDGLQLAREYGLPPAIVDFIAQHHGTSLITYFYHQALQRTDGRVEEESYRYDGPRPQTREVAVLMLADAAEAAVRSLAHPSPDRIEQQVRRIIRDKLEDGQLDECDLTFRDLDRIAQAFTRILTGIFHPRVEYPEVEGELPKRRRPDGSVGHKLAKQSGR